MPQADGASFGAGSEAGLTGRPKKKKRREEEEPQPFTAQREAGAQEAPIERIGRVEKATGATLPTRMTLAVSETTAQGETLERVSRLIAKKASISPQYVFGNTRYGDHTDPVWGGPVRLQTLQRMSRDGVNDAVVLGLLQQYYDPQSKTLRLPSLERVMKGPLGQRVAGGLIEAVTDEEGVSYKIRKPVRVHFRGTGTLSEDTLADAMDELNRAIGGQAFVFENDPKKATVTLVAPGEMKGVGGSAFYPVGAQPTVTPETGSVISIDKHDPKDSIWLLKHELAHAAGLGHLSPVNTERAGGMVHRGRGLTMYEVGQLRQKVGATPVPSTRPDVVARIVNVIASANPGMELHEALGVSVALAREGTDPAILEKNIAVIDQYYENSGQYERPLDARGRPRRGAQPKTFLDTLAFAAEATRVGVRFTKTAEVVAALNPYLATISAKEQRLRGSPAAALSPGLGEGLATRGIEALAAGPEAAERFRAEEFTRTAGGLGMPETLDLRLVSRRTKDWPAIAEELRQEIRLDETAWERSWLNKYVVSPTFGAIDAVWDEVSTLISTGAQGIEMAAHLAVGDAEGAERIVNRAVEQGRAIRADKLTLADVIHDNYGVPRGLAIGAEFLLGWYLDPLVLLGKGAQARRLLRTLPKLGEKTGYFGKMLRDHGPEELRKILARADDTRLANRQFLYTAKARAFDKRYGEGFLRAASEKDYERGIQAWTRQFRSGRMEERAAFSLPRLTEMAEGLRAAHPDLLRGVVSQAARRDAGQALISHFTFEPPPNSILQQVFRRSQALDDEARVALDGEIRQRSFDESLRVRPESADALDEAIQAASIDPSNALPMRYEIPTKLSPIPFQGLIKWSASKLGGTRLAETGLGRRTTRLVSVNPSNVIHYGQADDIALSFSRRAKRGLLSQRQSALYEREAQKASQLTAGRERALDALLDRMDKDVIRTWAKKHNVGEDFVETAMTDFRAAQADARSAVFGVIQEGQTKFTTGTPITNPILRSELANFRVVLDPLAVQRQLNKALGSVRRLRDSVYRIAGKALPRTDEVDQLALGSILPDLWRSAWRPIIHTWKWGAVARPAYILRVILLEEQTRFFASGATLFERMAAQKAIGKLTGGRLGSLLDDEVRFGDDVIRVGNPLKYENDIRAIPGLNQQAITENFMQGVLRKDRSLISSQRWGVLTKDDKEWAPALAHFLNHTAPASDAAVEVLRGVASGLRREESLGALQRWARTEAGRAERVSLGVPADDLDDWLRTVNDVVRGYIGDSAALARVSLRSAVEPEQLKRWAATMGDDAPAVHGPLAEAVLFNRNNNLLKRFMEGWYNTWVRTPEANINRFPYKNFWKSRAEKALYRGASDSGLNLTDDLKNAISRASDDFALRQTKNVMFDFTENSRFGEMFGFAAPFVQPYVENLAVWGHLLLRRNPAAVARLPILARMGEESGFISRDPETGEMVVSLDWMRYVSPLLMLGWGSNGWKLSAPLSSFNMFFQQSMDVKLPFSDAALPAPLPSLGPWAAWPLQRIFAGSDSRALESYLFAFGEAEPGVKGFALNMLPNWMEKALQAVAGPGVYENSWRSTMADFLTLHQFLGDEPNVKRAENQAKMMAGFRLFSSLFFPAQPRVEFPFAEIEDEWNNLVETKGYDEANKIFAEKYEGEYTLIQASKTYNGKEIEGLPLVRTPPTEFSLRLLRQPGFKEFAQRYPAWAAGLIVSSQHDEFSFDAWSSQTTAGDILYKNPQRFLRDAKAVEFWQTVDELDSTYDVLFEQLEATGRQAGTQEYDETRANQRLDMLDLYKRFPGIASQYMQQVTDDATGEVIGADWQAPEGKPPLLQLLKVAQVLEEPVFQQFPAGKALREYVDGRTKVADTLSRDGFDSIVASGAEDIKKEWDTFKDGLLEKYPEFEIFMDMYFRSDLGNIRTIGDRRVAKLQKDNPERYEVFASFDARLDDINNILPENDVEEDLKYQRRRNLIEAAYRDNPWAVKLYWQKKTHGEREVYLNGLAALPAVFMSRLDLELLLSPDPLSGKVGKAISNRAAGWWNEITKTSLEAERLTAAGQDDKKAYEDRARFVREHLGKDKDFDMLVKAADTIGWSLEQLGYTKGKSKEAYAWGEVLVLARYVNDKARREGVFGVDDFDDKAAADYRSWREAVLTYAEDFMEWSPVFKEQWDDLQRRSLRGGPVINFLVPDNVFPKLAGG